MGLFLLQWNRGWLVTLYRRHFLDLLTISASMSFRVDGKPPSFLLVTQRWREELFAGRRCIGSGVPRRRASRRFVRQFWHRKIFEKRALNLVGWNVKDIR